MHNKYNALESSQSHPDPTPQSMEKLSSTKVVLSARNVGDNCSKEPERNLPLPLPGSQMAHDLGSTNQTHCLRNWNFDKVLRGHEKGVTGRDLEQ